MNKPVLFANIPGYNSWNAMKARCNHSGSKAYPNYGGRGITICDEWKDNFEQFISDMGERPSDRHTIERLDTNGNYEPSNCVWATYGEQMNNKRNNRTLEHNGVEQTVSQWARELNISKDTIRKRLDKGFSTEEALQVGRKSRSGKPASAWNVDTGEQHRGNTVKELSEDLGLCSSAAAKRMRDGNTTPHRGYVIVKGDCENHQEYQESTDGLYIEDEDGYGGCVSYG